MRYRETILMLLSFLIAGVAFAQNNTNSPYSRYGYGQLADLGASNSRAMGGVAYGLRDKAHTNFANPASYTAIDSLTFVFEAGLSLQNTNFDNGTFKTNAKNTSFDYISMHFRVGNKFGMSLGLLPYTNVGYDMSNETKDATDKEKTYVTNYFGDGGLHQAYVGLAYKINRKLSIGANIYYLWGDVNHAMMQTFPYNTDAYGVMKREHVGVNSVKFDIGAQYSHQFGKKDFITFGAVFSPGYNLTNTTYVQDILGNSSAIINGATSGMTVNETVLDVKSGIPTSFGVGVAYTRDDRLTVGMDVSYQLWSKVSFMGNEDAFVDRTKISVGAEYLPNPIGSNILKRIKYRVGAYYNAPYYKLDGVRASKEWGVSAGFSIPIMRSRSYVNISGQYARVNGQTANFIHENQLRVNIGITFNERWFYKTRVN
ncbi:MAG: outer membrane protein transport protein [Bacteroidaceae bacterium]|nr:outer membrane protein transport protein [Bacteroidaceae bacterium]